MLAINKITSDPSQQMNLTGIPTLTIPMTLRFMPRIQRWIMGVQYNAVSIQGIAVTTSVNMLRRYRNGIPFGIACVTMNGLDPYRVTDFEDQTATLYLLDSDDVTSVETDWFDD